MARSRLIFLIIIGSALLIVIGALALQATQKTVNDATATAQGQATFAAAQMTQTAVVSVPSNTGGIIKPIFAGNKTPTNGLPQYICAADAFASYYTLQQLQVAGYDVQNGFNLGIIPFDLDDPDGAYNISEAARADLLESGKIDCLFTTLDSTALKGSGVITAIVDESAGADQLYIQPPATKLNDLRGKKVFYVNGSVSQFFTLYALTIAGLNPRTDVQMVGVDSVEKAVQAFNAIAKGEGAAVAGWEPVITTASKNGTPLIGSDKLRVIIDVIMTSRPTLKNKTGLVQRFHNAWFRALKAQFEDFPKAANQVAAWGNNDWSGIQPTSAEKDLGSALAKIAQAGLAENAIAMGDTSSLLSRLETAKRIWAAAGQTTATDNAADLINSRFVLEAAKDNSLATTGKARNDSFLLAAKPNLKEVAFDRGETLAVLPCQKFNFLPESADITREIANILDTCVYPVLSSSTGIYLKVVGSSAWPKTDPPLQEKDIRDIAQKRAQAVVDYLVKKGIDPRRFNLSVVIPPPERRNIESGEEMSKDRFVEMTLITIGR